MLTYPTVSLDDAEGDQFKLLKKLHSKFGFVPNVYGKLANAPTLASSYYYLSEAFEKTHFSELEKQIILLTISKYHQCHYCVAAHTVFSMQLNLPPEIILAVRKGDDLQNPKLQSLRSFTYEMLDTRGFPAKEILDKFLSQGYKEIHVLEIILAISMKTMSNFTNHMANTEIDDVLKPLLEEFDE